MDETWSYERAQIEQLGVHDHYSLKIISATGATKWLVVTQEQLDKIADVLTERG